MPRTILVHINVELTSAANPDIGVDEVVDDVLAALERGYGLKTGELAGENQVLVRPLEALVCCAFFDEI